MNNLLSETFGKDMDRVIGAVRAAFALQALPMYYVLLFAIGAYLFFRSRRLRIEDMHHVDLLLNEFPRLARLERGLPVGPGSERTGGLDGGKGDAATPANDGTTEKTTRTRRKLKFPWGRKKSDDTHIDQNLEADEIEKDSASADSVEEVDPNEHGPGLNKGESREGMIRVAVHDAPILLLSAAAVSAVLVFVSLLAPMIGGDPVTQLLQNAGEGWTNALARHLVSGPDSFFAAMIIYTVLGGVALAILPGHLFRFLNIEWLHIEPASRRSRFVRRMWRSLCFVNLNQLDASVEHWLTKMLPPYITLLLLSDVVALFSGFPLPPALAAAAHLMPAALPRMFAAVWSNRIVFRRNPGRHGTTILADYLAEHMSQEPYLGGLAGGAKVEMLETIRLEAENPIRDEAGAIPDRLVQALEVLGREDLGPFLSHAVAALLERQESVVASGPKGSGRAVVVGLSALEAAFRGGSTLVIAQDEAQAVRMGEWFAEFARNYPAARCLRVSRAQDNLLYEFKGAQNEVDILLCDLSRFDRIADHNGYLEYFWDRLDALVLMDVDTISPLARVELPFVVRRAAALARHGGSTLPVLVTVLDGGREDQRSFAELLGRHFVQLPLGHAVRARIDIMLVVAAGRGAVTFDTDQDLFMRFGAGLADAGYERYFLNVHPRVRASIERLDQARPTDRAEDFRDDPAVVSLVRLQPETLFSQVSEIRELSRSCRTGHHICFLMTPTDGFDAWLQSKGQLRQLLELRTDLLAPVIVPAAGNDNLLYKHLVRAVHEKKTAPGELDQLFGPRATALIAATGATRIPAISLIPDPLLGSAYHVDPAEVHEARRPTIVDGAILGEGQGAEPIKVICRELGVSRLIDAERQPVVLWPEKVFTLGDERVRVRGRAAGGVLECEPSTDDVETIKIRQVFVTQSSDISLTSDHVFASDGIGIYRSSLDMREVIIGYRTWKGSDLLRETMYGADKRIEASYRAEAAAVFLPGVDDEMAHLMAHVVRRHLRIMIGDTDDIVDVAHGCFEPFSKGVSANVYRNIVVVDTVPGGCGVCELVTPEFLRKVAAHIIKMHEAGARWYDLHDCHYTHLPLFDQVHPDALAERPQSTAERLVDYCRRAVLAEGDPDGQGKLDYKCNMWIPGEAPDSAPEYATAGSAALSVIGDGGPTPEYQDLLNRVYADTNRLRRLPLTPSGEEETTCRK